MSFCITFFMIYINMTSQNRLAVDLEGGGTVEVEYATTSTLGALLGWIDLYHLRTLKYACESDPRKDFFLVGYTQFYVRKARWLWLFQVIIYTAYELFFYFFRIYISMTSNDRLAVDLEGGGTVEVEYATTSTLGALLGWIHHYYLRTLKYAWWYTTLGRVLEEHLLFW